GGRQHRLGAARPGAPRPARVAAPRASPGGVAGLGAAWPGGARAGGAAAGPDRGERPDAGPAALGLGGGRRGPAAVAGGAGAVAQDHEAQAGAFFGSGALLLIAALAALSGWLRGARHRPVETGTGAVAKLGARNAARNPGRSLLTAGLLASAAFLLVAVEAF